MITNKKHQQGNILVSSLLILVTINLLGAGLLQTSVRESTVATFKSVDSEVFHITESCTHDVITWFETQTVTPAGVADVTATNINFMYSGSEGTTELNKLDGYSYGCTTTYITSKSVSAGAAIGSEVGSSGSEYGGSGGEVIKDYYQIISTGSGPDNAQKTINTIISVAY